MATQPSNIGQYKNTGTTSYPPIKKTNKPRKSVGVKRGK